MNCGGKINKMEEGGITDTILKAVGSGLNAANSSMPQKDGLNSVLNSGISAAGSELMKNPATMGYGLALEALPLLGKGVDAGLEALKPKHANTLKEFKQQEALEAFQGVPDALKASPIGAIWGGINMIGMGKRANKDLKEYNDNVALSNKISSQPAINANPYGSYKKGGKVKKANTSLDSRYQQAMLSMEDGGKTGPGPDASGLTGWVLDAVAKGYIEKNKNLNFVDRLYHPENYPSLPRPNGEYATVEMESGDNKVFPSIVYENGKLRDLKLEGKWAASDYAIKTGQYINAGSDAMAKWLAKNNYKRAFPSLWNQIKNDPSKYGHFADGGKISREAVEGKKQQSNERYASFTGGDLPMPGFSDWGLPPDIDYARRSQIAIGNNDIYQIPKFPWSKPKFIQPAINADDLKFEDGGINDFMIANFGEDVPFLKSGGAFKLNPKHKGFCTPLSKSTCTGKRRTFALNAKHHFKKWKHEEGGQTMESEEQQPQTSQIDIQKGELLVTPSNTHPSGWDIVKQYDNPSIYSPHAKNPNKEPMGNFVEAPVGAIVITKEMAKRFKKGDNITRSTIVRNILNRQEKNGTPTIQSPDETQMSKKGGLVVRKYENAGEVGPMGDEVTLQPYNNLLTNNSSSFDPWSWDKQVFMKTPEERSNLNPVNSPSYDLPSNRYITPWVNDLKNPNMSYIDDLSKDGLSLDKEGKTTTKESNGPDWKKILNTGLDVLPYAATLAQFPFKTDKAELITNNKYSQARQGLEGLETVLPVDDLLQKISNQEDLALHNSNYSINPAVGAARASQAHANSLNAINDVMGNKQRTELQLRNDKREKLANLDYQQGQFDANAKAQYNLETAQNKQAVRNGRMAVASHLADIAMQQRQYYNDRKTLGNLYPYVELGDDGQYKFKDDVDLSTKLLFTDDLDFLNFSTSKSKKKTKENGK